MTVYNFIKRTSQYDLYEMRSDYLPRKAERDGLTGEFGKEIGNTSKLSTATSSTFKAAGSVDELTSDQKDALLKKLHNGKGGLSLEEWDSFLIDLVDLGVISDSERMRASGALIALPNPDQNGTWHSTFRATSVTEIFDAWQGDPLQWLKKMDFYLMKEIKYASLEGNGDKGLFSQKAACAKVSDVLASLM